MGRYCRHLPLPVCLESCTAALSRAALLGACLDLDRIFHLLALLCFSRQLIERKIMELTSRTSETLDDAHDYLVDAAAASLDAAEDF